MQALGERLHLLLLDRRYVLVPKEIKRPKHCDFVIIKDPNLEDKAFLAFIEKNALELAKLEGVPNEKEVFDLAKLTGFWTEDDEKIMSSVNDHVKFLEGQLEKEKFLAKKNIIKKQLAEANRVRQEVLNKSQDFRSKSAEYLASESKIYASISLLTHNQFNSKVWETEEAFLRDRYVYTDFITFVASEITSEGFAGEKSIREIARSNEWRIMWMLGKENPSSIFNKKIADFNINQKMLCYWSKVYDSAFEDPERPDDDVINDDEQFDFWLANKHISSEEKRKNTANDKLKSTSGHHEFANILDGEYVESCTCGSIKTKAKGLGERQPHSADCLYGTWRYYTQEEKDAIADQVYGRNTSQTRAILEREQNKIADTSSMIEEQSLRDRKSRLKLGAQNNVVSKR